MDKWYVASLVAHLNWSGFLETSYLTLVYNNFKWNQVHEHPWIKVTKFMAGHHQTPSKLKPYFFTSCFNKAKDRAEIGQWRGRKTL